jgi:phenylalanyl-tRNA synthetase alpha chain
VGGAESVQDILERALDALAGARSTSELEQVRVRVLGRSGELTGVLRGLGRLPAADRPRVGDEANRAKAAVEARLAERQAALKAREADGAPGEALDLTLPGRYVPPGPVHPITRVQDEIIGVFERLGFSVAQGPEVESDYYNFSALNFPDDHPARDMQDTFHLGPGVLLRTHTSPVQVRTMKATRPPVRVICPGRVFRRDIADATHSPMFHQVEGLAVDRHITMADLKGTLSLFAREMFGHADIRFRPSFFPFTEPSAEVDVRCFKCGGQGCRFCKHGGWIEILGSGMVHPNVLRNVGYDPEEVTGWAFGMGVERVALLKYEIDDIRLLFDNDLRFLQQFAPGAGA